MTIKESVTAKGWYSVVKFSEINDNDENHLQFLEAITRFKTTPQNELPEEGFLLPDLVMKKQVKLRLPGIDMELTQVQHDVLSVGRVVGIEFEPFQHPLVRASDDIDGLIYVKPVLPLLTTPE